MTARFIHLLALLAGAPLSALAQLSVGEEAPQNLGKTRAGDAVLLGEHAGKVQAVTFWASWCGPCLVELPMLEKLQRALGPEKIRIVAVNTEDRDTFRRVTRGMGDWNVVLTSDPGKSAYAAYKGSSIPLLTIVSKTGKVTQVFTGYSENELRAVVTAIVDAVNE